LILFALTSTFPYQKWEWGALLMWKQCGDRSNTWSSTDMCHSRSARRNITRIALSWWFFEWGEVEWMICWCIDERASVVQKVSYV
jgi:hypothetical protein